MASVLIHLGRRHASSITKTFPKAIHPSFINIDPSLHNETEQKIFERFENESLETNSVILHTFPKDTCKYGYAITFTGKIESYLKYNKIKYVIDDKRGIGKPLPMKKLPWITYNQIHTADSQLIVERLNEEFDIDNDQHLTDKQKDVSFIFNQAMDRFYFVDIYRRYMSDANFRSYVGFINPEITEESAKKFKQFVVDQLWSHGIGRFDGDTVYKLHKSYIDSILGHIGDNLFFHGDKISSIDFSIYSQLGSMYSIDLLYPNTVNGKLHRAEEVTNYLERFEKAINKE